MGGSTRAALSSTSIEVNIGTSVAFGTIEHRRSIWPSASNIEYVVLTGMCVRILHGVLHVQSVIMAEEQGGIE